MDGWLDLVEFCVGLAIKEHVAMINVGGMGEEYILEGARSGVCVTSDFPF